MKKVLSLIACIGLSLVLNAQSKKVFGTKDGELIHESSESYEWSTDAKVLEKLDKWQDVKFGIMYHCAGYHGVMVALFGRPLYQAQGESSTRQIL